MGSGASLGSVTVDYLTEVRSPNGSRALFLVPDKITGRLFAICPEYVIEISDHGEIVGHVKIPRIAPRCGVIYLGQLIIAEDKYIIIVDLKTKKKRKLGKFARGERIEAIAMGRDGKLYILDRLYFNIRRIDISTGKMRLLAGTLNIEHSSKDGPCATARFSDPRDICVGHDGHIYITDSKTVRRIDLRRRVMTTVAQFPTYLSYITQSPDGTFSILTSDGHLWMTTADFQFKIPISKAGTSQTKPKTKGRLKFDRPVCMKCLQWDKVFVLTKDSSLHQVSSLQDKYQTEVADAVIWSAWTYGIGLSEFLTFQIFQFCYEDWKI